MVCKVCLSERVETGACGGCGQGPLPEDYETCGECGFDHEYESEAAWREHVWMQTEAELQEVQDNADELEQGNPFNGEYQESGVSDDQE